MRLSCDFNVQSVESREKQTIGTDIMAHRHVLDNDWSHTRDY